MLYQNYFTNVCKLRFGSCLPYASASSLVGKGDSYLTWSCTMNGRMICLLDASFCCCLALFSLRAKYILVFWHLMFHLPLTYPCSVKPYSVNVMLYCMPCGPCNLMWCDSSFVDLKSVFGAFTAWQQRSSPGQHKATAKCTQGDHNNCLHNTQVCSKYSPPLLPWKVYWQSKFIATCVKFNCIAT